MSVQSPFNSILKVALFLKVTSPSTIALSLLFTIKYFLYNPKKHFASSSFVIEQLVPSSAFTLSREYVGEFLIII